MFTIPSRRSTQRLALLPTIILGVTLAGGALSQAASAAGTGTWEAPTAGATVSGSSVPLRFATSDSSVTFVLPYASETAAVSGGVATGSFDSTRVANGPVTLVAQECNVLNVCDDVTESVTVANATGATAAAPAFSPVSGTSLQPGGTVTVTGTGGAEIIVLIDSMEQSSLATTLPYAYQVPTTLSAGTHQLELRVSNGGQSADATFAIVVPDTTPPVIAKLQFPGSFFPVKDGYRDHFFVLFTTNKTSVARLTIYRKGKPVAVGRASVINSNVVDLQAGAGLKPGRYQWQLTVTDGSGNVASTPMRTVVADKRRTVAHTATMRVNAASLSFKSDSGSCSSAKKSGTSIVLTSLSKCQSGPDQYFSVASANIVTVLKSAVDYGRITVRLASHGTGDVIAFDLYTGTFDVAKGLANGTTTLVLNDHYVGYPKPQLILGVGTAGGHTVTLSSVAVTYVYKTLSR